jgi:hypothetical protein
MATPAKAEWLIASEKKAIRKFTTCTPIAAHIGASRSKPSIACCMNRACMHSKGMALAMKSKRGVSSDMVKIHPGGIGRALGPHGQIRWAHMKAKRSRQDIGGQSRAGRSLLQNAAVKADHMCGVRGDQGEVVRDHNLREVTLGPESLQELAQQVLSYDIHAGGKFIQQQDLGSLLQRQRQEHPLQLAP